MASMMTPLKTSKPQKDLYHLISRTKNSHSLLTRANRMNTPRWVNPKDRIKWWNITPGDRVKLIAGKVEFRKKDRLEVLEVDREKNWLYLKDGPQHAVHVPNPFHDPDMPKFDFRPMPVHYSNVQLYIGEFEFPPKKGESERRVLPVYATRVGRSPPVWDSYHRRYTWTRYAAATTPRLPARHDDNGEMIRIEIPWPQYAYKEPPEPGLQDTLRDEVLRVTWVPPAPTVNPGTLGLGQPKPEDFYLETAGTARSDPSQPMEHFLTRELTGGYFSRASRTKRWQQRDAYMAKRFERWVKRETRESEQYADGRTMKEIRLEAKWKFERAEEERLKRKRALSAMKSPKGQKIARKTRRTFIKKAKKPAKLNRIVLKPAKNQYIPPGANVVDEVPYAKQQSERVMLRKDRVRLRKGEKYKLRRGKKLNL